MARCFYRLSDTIDPEERLESAALSKALHDVLGGDVHILPDKGSFPEHGLHLGMMRRAEESGLRRMTETNVEYWDDPAFQKHTTREWGIFDLDGAGEAVQALHDQGRNAILKSTLKAKHMIIRAPVGASLGASLGSMAYSFCDRPPCLMVQEEVEMRYERRFLIMNREIVTQSAVGVHLTPMSRFLDAAPGQDFEDMHLLTPGSREMVHLPQLTRRMTDKAREMAAECGFDNICIDLCLIGSDPVNGAIEPIEYNPMQPGMLGLYGCDPYALARGVARYLDLHPEITSGPAREAAKEVSSDWPIVNIEVLDDDTTLSFD